MEKENNVLISVKNLIVEYKLGKEIVHAVNDVSFDIARGETLGLVGETGAGKTTIAKAILGILPDPPAKVRQGEIVYNGTDILKIKSDKDLQKIRGKEISMVFQDPMSALNPVMTVGSQIAEVILQHNKISKKDAEDRAKDMLEQVGIPRSRYYEYPHQFSGGMKQRVIIAIALACTPNLLLADEPTTALDVTIQAQVLQMIKKLKEEKNTSMLLITHDLGIIAEMCDNVAVIYAGEIVEYGSLREIFKEPAHPYTKGLFDALPNMNEDADKLHPIEGLPPDPSMLPEGCSFHPRCPYATEECMNGEIPVVSLGGTHRCMCRNLNKEEHLGGK